MDRFWAIWAESESEWVTDDESHESLAGVRRGESYVKTKETVMRLMERSRELFLKTRRRKPKTQSVTSCENDVGGWMRVTRDGEWAVYLFYMCIFLCLFLSLLVVFFSQSKSSLDFINMWYLWFKIPRKCYFLAWTCTDCVLQLLHIYSVPTNEVLALPVTDRQQSTLSLKIQSALHVDRSDQELLTPTGTVPDLITDLSQYCRNQVSVTAYTDSLQVWCNFLTSAFWLSP